MAQPARGRRAEGADPFPWVVCLVSVAIGVTILFRSTIPGLAEQQDLRAVETRRQQDLSETTGESHDLRARRQRLQADPETVLIELDRHGIDPASLPPRPEPEAGSTPPPEPKTGLPRPR